MYLNTLSPAEGSKKAPKRVGRGIGSGLGKTCGRGHKGQKARAGGFHKVGFEGGQMPLQRRLPKVGFTSLAAMKMDQIRLHELAQIDAEEIDLAALKQAGLIKHTVLGVKVIASGKIEKAVKVRGLAVTRGARAAIEAVGGSILD